ncbi:GerMN domain-containing protein [Bacillus alkalicellulosilyticus]|uniref:GerMN domain-containing protein n=1 Tax=Alkalihalobacterium alkalicellulosilyticum TaxID=1912214 RepID=UPI00099763B4|nr:GerMN domain-containing protein [Bacillus alkalicellulosilyticus]
MRKYLKTGVPILMLFTLVITGCSTTEDVMKEMDAPPVTYVDEGDSLGFEEESTETEVETEVEGTTDTITRELYLIDENGLVVPQTFELPRTEGAIRQSLEYLVADGPITNLLPNGFRAVLPAGTEIDVHLNEDGIAIADFSEEFTNYQPEEELKILQAITWTITQFENVNSVKIRINGYDQETMPVNNTPIGVEGFSRANGINLETNDVVDVVNSKGVTLYFLAQNGDNEYYVPVTRRVENNGNDNVKEVVQQLLNGPSVHTKLLTDFRQGVELVDEPLYENGVVTLNFNEAILSQLEGTAISNDVLNMIVLSLTEQNGVEQVSIKVDGMSEILKASGETLAEPVSRPNLVNAEKF